MEQSYQIGLVVYPGMTQLDITGPHQVLSFVDNAKIHFLWKNTEPVTSDRGLTLANQPEAKKSQVQLIVR